ncbi:trimeric intracellular cation channel family protein, partial [Streptomyces sp. NPDC001220]
MDPSKRARYFSPTSQPQKHTVHACGDRSTGKMSHPATSVRKTPPKYREIVRMPKAFKSLHPRQPSESACLMQIEELTGAVQYVMDLFGIFAFALSGAFLAVRKDFDIFGAVILSEAAGLGGGLFRDLVL